MKKLTCIITLFSVFTLSACLDASAQEYADEVRPQYRDSIIYRPASVVDSDLKGKDILNIMPSKQDGDKADVSSELDALEAMLKQGAYILWNHPGWPDDKATMYPIHEKLIAEGKIHGFEVWNDAESYPVTYDWVEEYGLHPFANSDIHGAIEFRYGARRPMTLVFAKEKTLESVKEAMFAGRTLAFFNNFLMGKQEFIAPLVKECLTFELQEDKGDYCIYNVVNKSDIKFQLQIGDTVHQVTVHPRSDNAYVEIAKDQDVTFVNCILGKGKYHSVPQSEL
jgi:hypothetical protein